MIRSNVVRKLLFLLLTLRFGLLREIPEDSDDLSPDGSSKLSRDFQCTAERYRSFTGRCNNLNYPEWGMRGRPLQRLIPASYNDANSSPRFRSSQGHLLPSARRISASLFPDYPNPDQQRTLMIMVWGFFIINDISAFDTDVAEPGSQIQCCYQPIKNESCFPIYIPKGDEMTSPYEGGCMEYVRTKSFVLHYGKREQINEVSSYVDGSTIYGKNTEISRTLRTHTYGKLSTVIYRGKHYIPFQEFKENCYFRNKCYKLIAGHPTASLEPRQTAIHTLFVREHNRLASEFGEKYPDWNDETLFQEARRFVIATIQHITYKEFLPALVGKENVKRYNLGNDDTYAYDPTVNPTALNEFGAAAIRSLASAAKGLIQRGKEKKDEIRLRDVYHSPEQIWQENGLDEYLKGIVRQPAEQIDPYISSEITDYLFKRSNQKYGLDYVALYIQRGRDHGIPAYLKFREFCGLPRIYRFSDLFPSIPYLAIRKLEQVYRSVQDIDLLVGGLMERKELDGLLGPTFTCIVVAQFRMLKFGDRFWYENLGQPSSFDIDQVEQIKKTSLARLICNNANSIKYVQKNVFLKESDRNHFVFCGDTDNLPNPDFSYRIYDESIEESPDIDI